MMAIHNVLTADFFTASSFVTSDNPTGAYGLVDRFSWLADYDDVINLVSSAAFAFLPVLVGFSAGGRTEASPPAVTPAYYWPPQELASLLERSGFTVLDMERRQVSGARDHGSISCRVL